MASKLEENGLKCLRLLETGDRRLVPIAIFNKKILSTAIFQNSFDMNKNSPLTCLKTWDNEENSIFLFFLFRKVFCEKLLNIKLVG